MATLANCLTFSRAQAQTDSNGLTDTNGIVFANEALLDFRRRLITAGVDASQLQESHRDGTAGTGTYLYPTDMFWLKAIELNYEDTDPGGYRTAQQIDAANPPAGESFSSLRENASKEFPMFDDRGDWFEIYPPPTSSDSVSQLMRIFYFKEPTEFTATTDTVSYPESLDYRILGLRIASDYLDAIEKFDLAAKLDEKYEKRVVQLIATLSRGSQMPIQATSLSIDGWMY